MDGQTAKLIARIAENLPKKMSSDVIQGWIDNPKRLQKFLSGLISELDFSDFFQTRPGLWVSEDFRRLVLAKAVSSDVVGTNHFDLPRVMTDAEIERKLEEDFGPHTWDEGALCVTLQKWLTEQEDGRSGRLLNNDFANIFYTSSCVVRVHWLAVGRRWFVVTWSRGVVGWRAGHRAFSPAT
ncbi:MAG: hypothetical protein ABIF06_00065 [bacterium]